MRLLIEVMSHGIQMTPFDSSGNLMQPKLMKVIEGQRKMMIHSENSTF
jgi:hypothetical protein